MAPSRYQAQPRPGAGPGFCTVRGSNFVELPSHSEPQRTAPHPLDTNSRTTEGANWRLGVLGCFVSVLVSEST